MRVASALIADGMDEDEAGAAALAYLVPDDAVTAAAAAGICSTELAALLDVTIDTLADRFHQLGLTCPIATAFYSAGIEAAEAENVVLLVRSPSGRRAVVPSCEGCHGPMSPVAELLSR